MSLIVHALDASLAGRDRVHFLSDGSHPLELGANSRRAAAWLEGLVGRGGTVAALLTGSAGLVLLHPRRREKPGYDGDRLRIDLGAHTSRERRHPSWSRSPRRNAWRA